MKISALVVSVISVLVPAAGDAATLTVMGVNSAGWSVVDPARTTALASDASWAVAPVILPNLEWSVIDPCVSACSPFDPMIYGTRKVIDDSPLAGWQTLPFFAVWSGAANEAILRFSRPQTALQLLWGSLDGTNLIEFFHGNKVFSLSGAELPTGLVKTPGQGAALLRISGLTFDRVRFTSQAGAFEMSNITSVAAVPLPPALALLVGACGLLGAAARRRRA